MRGKKIEWIDEAATLMGTTKGALSAFFKYHKKTPGGMTRAQGFKYLIENHRLGHLLKEQPASTEAKPQQTEAPHANGNGASSISDASGLASVTAKLLSAVHGQATATNNLVRLRVSDTEYVLTVAELPH